MTSAQEQAIYNWILQGAQNNSCTGCDTTNVTYSGTIQPLFQNKCNGCHSGSNPSGSLDLTQYGVCNTIALDGRLAGSVQHLTGFSAMPPSGGMLPACEIDEILIWIQDGAPNN
jgi:cytochrome c5